MITEPVKTFSRKFMGYDASAVDAHIEMLTTKQQLLLDDVESLRARLQESGEQTAALRKEVAALTDTSPSPHAMQKRMAKMLQRAVDEVAEMQAEARAEADALIAAAEAEAEAAERKRDEVLADMAAQQKGAGSRVRTDQGEARRRTGRDARRNPGGDRRGAAKRRAGVRAASVTPSRGPITTVTRHGARLMRRPRSGSRSSSS